MDELELIDFLEWAEDEGYVWYKEALKIEMVKAYLKSKD
jgi:hypothetical protein